MSIQFIPFTPELARRAEEKRQEGLQQRKTTTQSQPYNGLATAVGQALERTIGSQNQKELDLKLTFAGPEAIKGFVESRYQGVRIKPMGLDRAIQEVEKGKKVIFSGAPLNPDNPKQAVVSLLPNGESAKSVYVIESAGNGTATVINPLDGTTNQMTYQELNELRALKFPALVFEKV